MKKMSLLNLAAKKCESPVPNVNEKLEMKQVYYKSFVDFGEDKNEKPLTALLCSQNSLASSHKVGEKVPIMKRKDSGISGSGGQSSDITYLPNLPNIT